MFRPAFLSRRAFERCSAPIIVIVAMASAACSDATSSSGRDVSLTFATPAAAVRAAAIAQPGATALDLTVNDGQHTLVITSAELVLREVELQVPATADCAAEAGGDSPDCAEMDIGPMLVSLPVTAGVSTTPLTVQVPAGTYHEIEFTLRRPDDDAAGRAFVAAHPAFADISVRVAGTFDGQPFELTSAVRAKMELEFSAPLVIDASDNNITVDVDLASWFRDGASALIDPRAAGAGTTARATIEQNIQRSFHAFEDDDRDGRDDHGGGGADDSTR